MLPQILPNKNWLTRLRLGKLTAGFSLIEVVLVISLVVVSFTGIMNLVIENSRSEAANRNDLVVANLAQEGLEMARQIRDENYVSGSAFYKDLASGSPPANPSTYTWALDYRGRSSLATLVAITDAGAILKLDSNNWYQHASGTATAFSRMVTAEYFGTYLRISSQIYWLDHNQPNTYTASTILYDWE